MSRKIAKKKRRTFAIFVEGGKGGSEDLYFSAFKHQQWVRDLGFKLDVIPCKGLDKLLEKAFKAKHEGKSLSDYYKVAFVLDKDHITRERFDKLLKMDYIIGFSNPKFEFWLLAHFEKQLQENYSDVEKSLKKYILDYHKKHPKIAHLAKIYAQAIENIADKNTPNFDEVCTSVGSVIQEIF